ncbi:DUF7331 family protein [Halorientalis halophila]|uniref:DUF7331 family protein n=1 Tax=Halorientalis halophila TaxID=3108499 RepID=UPI0030094D18
MARTPVDDADTEPDAAGERAGSLVALEAADGVLIYDRHEHRAWLQSDGAVSVTDLR